MGRSPCCDEVGLKKGPWMPEEDQKLVEYIQKNGHGSWRNLPKSAGINRCGKSCRLRWTNYLRPDIRRGKFSEEEERLIIHLHSVLGNKWSKIATSLSGRTDNEIKNYWNTHLKKQLLLMGIDPVTHRRRTDLDLLGDLPKLLASANFSNFRTPLEIQLRRQSEAAQLAWLQILQSLAQIVPTSGPSHIFDPNNRFNDIIHLSQQLGALVNSSITQSQNPILSNSCTCNLQASRKQEKFSLMNSSCYNEGDANQIINSYSMLASELTPSLASASSPEINVTANDHNKPQPVNLEDMSGDCSNSTGFEVWEGLDDSDSDRFWENILDKIPQGG